MIETLNRNPIATIQSVIVLVVGGVVAVLNPDVLSFKDYCIAAGAFNAGTGVLGYARSVAGKGGPR